MCRPAASRFDGLESWLLAGLHQELLEVELGRSRRVAGPGAYGIRAARCGEGAGQDDEGNDPPDGTAVGLHGAKHIRGLGQMPIRVKGCQQCQPGVAVG